MGTGFPAAPQGKPDRNQAGGNRRLLLFLYTVSLGHRGNEALGNFDFRRFRDPHDETILFNIRHNTVNAAGREDFVARL